MSRPRFLLSGLVAFVLALAIVSSAAAADPADSSNWAGYAIARTDATTGAPASFRAVSGSWTQPAASCTAGSPSYSAFWIGLGGAAATSTSLEQIGTSSDCTAAGKPVYSVWYELVPAASVKTKLKISAGDRLHAVVAVDGTSVTLRLQNLTRHTVLTKRLTMAAPDVSSAEWIAEAPSGCNQFGRCQVLPLADFGTVSFSKGLAVTTDGRTGAIASSQWDATPIRLLPDTASVNGIAVPGALTSDGAGFSVTRQSAS
ncbi:MAG: hypothetical protein QOH73_524 [Gaiellaceae bacterium]|nr:hypothetical protein [Gaiellaceae bacterium]